MCIRIRNYAFKIYKLFYLNETLMQIQIQARNNCEKISQKQKTEKQNKFLYPSANVLFAFFANNKHNISFKNRSNAKNLRSLSKKIIL